MVEQFLVVAGAHFLALLSPGPDFFLIMRAALVRGWRSASGVCAGVALANAVFIAMAVAGLSAVRPGSIAFAALQWGGCLYLAWLGSCLLRSRGSPLAAAPAAGEPAPARGGWLHGLGQGLACGLLNPKNALFYASLFSLLAGTPRTLQLLYGAWMVAVVLGWDLLMAAAAGRQRVVAGLQRHMAAVERTTGAVLLLIAAGVALHALR